MAAIALSALASLGVATPTALAGTTALGAAIPVTEGALAFAGTGASFALPTTAAGLGLGLWNLVSSAPVVGLLSGASTAVSIMQQRQAGELRAEGFDMQAREAEIEAVGEQTAHHDKAARIKRELLKTLGEDDVAFAASGIDISFGGAAQNRSTKADEAYGELRTDRAGSDARVAMFGARSLAYQRAARMTRSGTRLSEFATGLEGAARIARRGVV